MPVFESRGEGAHFCGFRYLFLFDKAWTVTSLRLVGTDRSRRVEDIYGLVQDLYSIMVPSPLRDRKKCC